MRSIRSRYISIISIAVILSRVTIGGISTRFIQLISNTYTEELLTLKCDDIQNELDSYVRKVEDCVDTASYYARDEIEGTSDKELKSYLKNVDNLFYHIVKNTDGIITYYYRIDPSVSNKQKGFWYSRYGRPGFKAAELTDLEAYDENEEGRTNWYYTPKNKGEAVWIGPYVNKNLGDGVKMISYVTPVYWKGRFIGVLGVDYDYNALVKHMHYSGNFKGAYTFLTNEDDTIIYHPDIEGGTLVSEISSALSEDSLSKLRPVVDIEYDGQPQRAAWQKLSNGMILYLAVPVAAFKEFWYKFAATFIAVALMILVAFVIITTLLANRITRPLTRLTEAALEIDKGNYNVDLDYDRDDEVGVLTRTFKQLIKHIELHITDLNDRVYKDALTSVRNKGAFDMYLSKLDDAIKLKDESIDTEFAICVFDCNYLKQINDNYGHEKGDIFLKNCCNLICQIFDHSPVFRIGGDEFASILQGKDYQNRFSLCEEFDREVKRIGEKALNPWDKADLASGIAVYHPETDKDTNEVFRRADKAMYEDKDRKKAGIIRDLKDVPELW